MQKKKEKISIFLGDLIKFLGFTTTFGFCLETVVTIYF